MPKLLKESDRTQKSSKEEQMALERENDILLLLRHLAVREEVTIKIVLDCLYDIGAVNLINHKFPFRPLNRFMKAIARMSKPAFRIIAYYWFKQNCPQLITNWLMGKVAFEKVEIPVPQTVEVEADSILDPQQSNLQIQQLRSQVRFLTGILIAVVTIFGSSFIWLFYNFQSEPSLPPQPAKVKLVNQ
ncbi:hypothetical protein IQ238_18960 [Pleurocapsales cyanobacterium LEGE 06147]|nr:hypothetical protein [Pleurocapsales cyanobacterium LEGE 06147]